VTVAVDTSVAIPLLVRSHHDHAAVVRWWARGTYEAVGVKVIIVT
jgi:hypothetical protein